jgi:hypothetical protein
MKRIAMLAAALCLESTVGAESLTDVQWGETRCDLVSQENREPCIAAHLRLGIPADKTAASATAGATPANGDEPDAAEIARAKKIVADSMKDPTSVMFKDVVFFKEKQTVCGSVNAKNGYGGYGGYRLFRVGADGEVHTSETDFSESAMKDGCSLGPWPPRFPDDPKETQRRAELFDSVDGPMAPVLQEDALAWLEHNQGSTDREVVRAMVDLCELMSNRGSKPFAARLAAIEQNAAEKKVRSECGGARKKVEHRD